ncbi:terpenoid synthase [Podospora aff. communis PSN243]|uniref:Terpene synthase n=1 Tax=Podospora aff. communis PSN243 TaxID=3040156 RepID=A0AAV9GD16_9PEZI|nr:terpenoid synthase [Podospora aff. communis PSN243]
MAGELVTVPDFLRDWPWKRSLNKHYEEAKAASLEWFQGFRAFDPKSEDAFNRCDFARCRTGTDLMTLFYTFDEYSDVEDKAVTKQMADILMDAIRNPDKPRPQGECCLGEMTRQFWSRGRQTSTAMGERHLIETMQQYVDGVVLQSDDRTRDRLRTIDSYWPVRRHTSGCLPAYALTELELEMPEEVYRHPLLERIRECAVYIVSTANDVYSYPVERARGHALHNLVTVVMHQMGLSPQAAIDWIADWVDGIVQDFLQCRADLPSWGPEIDAQVNKYVDGLGAWVRGNDHWSFESQRYFGTAGTEIRRTRQIYMLPRVEACEARSLALREGIPEVERHDAAGLQICASVHC